MPNLKEIERQMGRLSRTDKFTIGDMIKKLSSLLREDESVMAWVRGPNSLLVATENRLIYQQEKLLGKDSEIFPYKEISYVECKKKFLGYDIKISSRGKGKKIDQIYGKYHPKDFCVYVSELVSKTKYSDISKSVSSIKKSFGPYCTKCGNKSEKSDKFCSKCGDSLRGEKVAPAVGLNKQKKIEYKESPQENKKKTILEEGRENLDKEEDRGKRNWRIARNFSIGFLLLLILLLIAFNEEISSPQITEAPNPAVFEQTQQIDETKFVLKATESYAEDVIDYGDYGSAYEMLSSSAKPSDFDWWSDRKITERNTLLMGGITYEFVRIENPQIEGTAAKVDVKYRLKVQGAVNTRTKTISLIKEGDSWKIAEDVDFT
ncbi:hypothetical protein BMS3Abin16_00920 [archaeon BMS3Abin16]|nr:hypothetical protein BMS3Abin16_00920 [archaeon BMS3Abin16]